MMLKKVFIKDTYFHFDDFLKWEKKFKDLVKIVLEHLQTDVFSSGVVFIIK